MVAHSGLHPLLPFLFLPSFRLASRPFLSSRFCVRRQRDDDNADADADDDRSDEAANAADANDNADDADTTATTTSACKRRPAHITAAH